MSKVDIYQTVTDRIIAGLEQAQAEIAAGIHCEMPWVRAASKHQPLSLKNRPYRGINYVILSMLGHVFPSQVFGTYKGWQDRGCQVRKGEKGIPVVFWKSWAVKDAATGEEKNIPLARGYTVFAGEQVEGFDCGKHLADAVLTMPNRAQAIAAADNAVKQYVAREGVTMAGHPTQASYSPAADRVFMPAMAAFHSTEGYYGTLLHELAHSSGHEKRLNRDLSKRFGSAGYALEELVVEFSAAMMCARLKIETETRQDHIRYIASWLQALRDNPKAAVSAAAAAQKASDCVLGAQEFDEVEEEQAIAA